MTMPLLLWRRLWFVSSRLFVVIGEFDFNFRCWFGICFQVSFLVAVVHIVHELQSYSAVRLGCDCDCDCVEAALWSVMREIFTIVCCDCWIRLLVSGVVSWFWLRIVVKILFLLLLCMHCLRFVMWLWCFAWLRLRLCGKFCARQIVVWWMLNFAEPNFCWFCSIMIRAVLFYCTNFDMQSIVFDNCALLFCSTDFQL